MPARREKRLLLILCAVVALCALGVVLNSGAGRLKSARAKLGHYRTLAETLQQSMRCEADLAALSNRLKDQLSNARKKFYSTGEIGPFTFGSIVRKKLSARGIAVIRYQVLEEKRTGSLELSVSGPIKSLVFFLKDVSDYERFWNISSFALTLREGSSLADAHFKIGYEVFDSPPASAPAAHVQMIAENAGVQATPRLASPAAVLSLFIGMSPAVSPPSTAMAAAPVEKKPVDAPWLKYLGYFSGVSGRPRHLLKDARSGRVITVAEGTPTDGWSCVKAGDGRMIIRNSDEDYVVNTR